LIASKTRNLSSSIARKIKRTNSSKLARTGQPSSSEDFASAAKRVRDTWVQEFNAGHAEKVAALYAEEAVLMRRNGSLHRPDSIQAELERSITRAQGRSYTVESLHTEHSGDLGYDTEDFTSRFRRHLPYRVKKNAWRMEDCGACLHSQSAVEIGHR
jgi:ketosteroid isomerase-like protein